MSTMKLTTFSSTYLSTHARNWHLFKSQHSILASNINSNLLTLHKKCLHLSSTLNATHDDSSKSASPYFFPPFPRHSFYGTPTSEDIQTMKSFLTDPNTQFLENYNDILPYCTDWTGKYRSVPLQDASNITDSDNTISPEKNDPIFNKPKSKPLVFFPRDTQEVSKLLKFCNNKMFAVSPQSGNTGLVGGSIPVYDEIVINMSKMNKIIDFQVASGVLTCEAGCIHQNLNDFLKQQSPSFMLPYDLGSKGSCMIGGNINTNTGGLRLIRYGNLNANVLGLEVVLPDGTILNALSTLKKDNTGLKLHQMFIGSEGTLGIITKVAIQCPIAPSSVQTCMLRCESFKSLLSAALRFKQDMSDIVGAVEFFDHLALQIVIKTLENTKDVFNRDKSEIVQNMFSAENSNSQPFYLLLETHGQNEDSDKGRMKQFVESLLNESMVSDGVLAENESQRQNMWFFREQIPIGVSHIGSSMYFDLTLPFSENMYSNLVSDIRKDHGQSCECLIFGLGHIGDGNIHVGFAFLSTQNINSKIDFFKELMYKKTLLEGGSISSEHGMGIEKTPYMKLSKRNDYMDVLKSIKKSLDPNMIMKPYIFFD